MTTKKEKIVTRCKQSFYVGSNKIFHKYRDNLYESKDLTRNAQENTIPEELEENIEKLPKKKNKIKRNVGINK